MTSMSEMIEVLLLILVANGSPVFVSFLFSHRLSLPIDFGLILKDSQPLFGQSKTWRGLISSLAITALFSYALNSGLLNGLLIAGLAMTGDLLSSFIKRRLNKGVSSRALFLDQIPESLFPALGVMAVFHLRLMQVIEIVAAFIIIEITLSVVLYRLGIRKKPY